MVIGPFCGDIRILLPGYRTIVKLVLCASVSSSVQRYKVSSYLLVPSPPQGLYLQTLQSLSPTHPNLLMTFREVCSNATYSEGTPLQQQPHNSIIRPTSSSATLTSSSLTGPQRPSHEFLWLTTYATYLAGKDPHPASVPISHTRCTLPSLQPNGFQLPATLKIIQANHILPWKPRVISPCHYEACLP